MKNVEDILAELVTRLSAVTGCNTCKIGLEPNMTPDDYPIIRLVPSRLEPIEANRRKVSVMVYYGSPIHAFDGMDALYTALLAMEREIVGLMIAGDGYRIKHAYTITDEDRLSTYKLFMSLFEVQG